MKSVMAHNFSQIPRAEIQRSRFDRSHGYKTTLDSGYLVPIYVDEALPGDTFNCSTTLFGRLATPVVPIMDNLRMETFFFAVPYRLVWDNWQKFNGEQKDPGDSTDFLIPQLVAPVGGFTVGSLSDYFGLPTGVAGISVSSLWHRAYNLVYNEWFRDQNLQDSVVVPTGDGPDTLSDFNLLRRGKRHDYFTSCLPWPQKGPGVELPLGTTAPIKGIGFYPGISTVAIGASNTYQTDGSTMAVGSYAQGTDGLLFQFEGAGAAGPTNLPEIYADLTQASAATINSLRQAFQLQRLYERDARGGSRYTEIIRSHFGVVSPDSRLQRPEYLGGSTSRIIIHPVQQTSSTDTTSPQGNLAAFGIVSDSGTGFTKSFTEHTLIIGMVQITADLTYQQGIPRMFSRLGRFDFFWPALAHLGEQAVLNKEIMATGVPATDDDVFGYQERYAEYRYFPSQITGKFRSSDPQSLDVWHLSQEFGAVPELNAAFIVDDPPLDRCIAVPSEPQLLLDVFMNLKCARPMPVYGVPGLVDHF